MPSIRDNARTSFKTTLAKADDTGTNPDLERLILGGILGLSGTALVSKSINDLRRLNGQKAADS